MSNVRDLFTNNTSGLGFSLRHEAGSDFFVIDSESRTITAPADFENFGVESDENTERVYFECPQFVGDDIDLADMNLYINFKNANGELDKYIIDDVVSDGSNVRFSWVLSRKCTRYKGTLTFIVCAVKTNENAEIVKEWNTTLCTGQVLEGLEVENPEIDENTVDLVDQLVSLINNKTAEIETKAADALASVETAKDAAINEIKETGESVENTLYANAVKGYASGEAIFVYDVSPLPHIVKAKVYGKNVFNSQRFSTFESTTSPYISEVGQGYIVITSPNGYFGNGVSYPNVKLRDLCPNAIVGKTYTFTFETDSPYNRLMYLSRTATSLVSGCSYVFTEDMLNSDIHPYGFNAERGETQTICIIKNIQLEEGDTATEYEPWIDPTTVELQIAQMLDDSGDESVGIETPDANGVVEFVTEPNVLEIGISIFGSVSINTGKTIEFEYNKDTNKAFEGVQENIKMLDDDIAEMKNNINDMEFIEGITETPEPNHAYFDTLPLGGGVPLSLPTTANVGDLIYYNIMVGNAVGGITIENHEYCSDFELTFEANTGYEIFFLWNGSIWIASYSEYTKSN